MDELLKYLNELMEILNIKRINDLTIEQARNIIRKTNEFLYTNYDGIGNTTELKEKMDFEFFSDYHKFWKENHEEILNPTFDNKKIDRASEVLHDLYLSNKAVYYELDKKQGLTDEQICKISFFTAPQNFRGSIDLEKCIKIYKNNNMVFDKNYIFNNPTDFLKNIGIENKDQIEKRKKYAKECANFLINLECEPYEIIKKFNNDVALLKDKIINNGSMGFGDKKANMFIRDMVVSKIWTGIKNVETLDVASDINTMKVALRTGILKTSIPLVSSFLDIFDYQYSIMDKYSALAWRRVWENWKEKYPKECIEGPYLLDYLLYGIIGKGFCNENLYIYKCVDNNHTIKWMNGKKRKCNDCGSM